MIRTRDKQKGLSLIEVLVSMSIFLILGTSLIGILRQGLSTWKRGESRKTAYESAWYIFSSLKEDLQNLFDLFENDQKPETPR